MDGLGCSLLSSFPSGFELGLSFVFVGVGVGFGARSDRLPCPCCLSRALPVWFPLPGGGVHLTWLMWGFRVLALLGCWSRQVVLSPFLGCVRFFPFVLYYYNMTTRYIQYTIRFIFSSFASIHTIRNNLI